MNREQVEFFYHPFKFKCELLVSFISCLMSFFYLFVTLHLYRLGNKMGVVYFFIGLGFLFASMFMFFSCFKNRYKTKIIISDEYVKIHTNEKLLWANKRSLLKSRWLFADGYFIILFLLPICLILFPIFCVWMVVNFCVPRLPLTCLKTKEISDAYFKQSVLGKVFGYGTLVLVFGQKKRVFTMVKNPQQCCEEIKSFLKTKRG